MAATTMNVSLPASMKAFVDERLSDDGYGTVSEYVRELIRADQERREDKKTERLLRQHIESSTHRSFGTEDDRSELLRRRSVVSRIDLILTELASK